MSIATSKICQNLDKSSYHENVFYHNETSGSFEELKNKSVIEKNSKERTEACMSWNKTEQSSRLGSIKETPTFSVSKSIPGLKPLKELSKVTESIISQKFIKEEIVAKDKEKVTTGNQIRQSTQLNVRSVPSLDDLTTKPATLNYDASSADFLSAFGELTRDHSVPVANSFSQNFRGSIFENNQTYDELSREIGVSTRNNAESPITPSLMNNFNLASDEPFGGFIETNVFTNISCNGNVNLWEDVKANSFDDNYNFTNTYDFSINNGFNYADDNMEDFGYSDNPFLRNDEELKNCESLFENDNNSFEYPLATQVTSGPPELDYIGDRNLKSLPHSIGRQQRKHRISRNQGYISVESVRRENHNQLERKRRSELRNSFEYLVKLIPELDRIGSGKCSKVRILSATTNYVRLISSKRSLYQKYLAEKDILIKEVESFLQSNSVDYQRRCNN